MSVDHIRYDLLAQDALRGVVRTVLEDAAKRGLPGDHHFYITFDTRAEGVQLSPRMLSQYPKEMTVVLQHQFWDLVISETAFQVGLSFGGIPERLTIPFAAIQGFFDPSVQFSLQFAQADETAAQEQDSERENVPPVAERSKKRPVAQHGARAPSRMPAVPTPANPKSAHSEGTPPEQGDAGKAAPAEKESEKPDSGGEVVRLDRFRKK
jgi:uncharacterized protein